MTGVPALSASWHACISDIDAQQWNALVHERERPFLQWEWLRLLEDSGSVAPAVGWQPCHLAVRSQGRLVAVAPLYLKVHSDGEFVFDHAWAQMAAGMGVSYYPKMVGMSPFTPVGIYRFLISPDVDEVDMTLVMLREIEQFCRERDVSGAGFNFVQPTWGRILEGAGFKAWVHQGFAWLNAGFFEFEDYLAGLKANHRRNIRRERLRLYRSGIQTRCFFADAVPSEYFSLMYAFYARHNDRFGQWSCKFLTPAFFQGLHNHFASNILLIAAFAPGETEPLAMSMLIVSGDRLFGRYWGARAEVEFLHFELCYYRPMEWMIEHGMRLFDPGMGGVHKAFRGFVSTPAYSLHAFCDQRLHQAMAGTVTEYNRMEMRDIAALNSILPYRQRR